MFEAIRESIPTIISTPIGSTGYLDQICNQPPAKGVDAHGREFFTLPLKQTVVTTGKTFQDVNRYECNVTLFQRYSDQKNLWVLAAQADFLVHGGVGPLGAAFVEPILLKVLAGEEVTVEVPKQFHNWEKKVITISLASV